MHSPREITGSPFQPLQQAESPRALGDVIFLVKSGWRFSWSADLSTIKLLTFLTFLPLPTHNWSGSSQESEITSAILKERIWCHVLINWLWRTLRSRDKNSKWVTEEAATTMRTEAVKEKGLNCPIQRLRGGTLWGRNAEFKVELLSAAAVLSKLGPEGGRHLEGWDHNA